VRLASPPLGAGLATAKSSSGAPSPAWRSPPTSTPPRLSTPVGAVTEPGARPLPIAAAPESTRTCTASVALPPADPRPAAAATAARGSLLLAAAPPEPVQHQQCTQQLLVIRYVLYPRRDPRRVAAQDPRVYVPCQTELVDLTPVETPELMAAATMNRGGYPPISYHTPQSNSPASVQSPQHDQHGRPIYGQPPSQMPQSMYYTPYASAPLPQQSPYQQHPASAPQQPMATQSLLMSHQQNQQMQHQHQHHPQTPGMTGSPKSRMSQTPLQRPPSGLGPPQPPPPGPPASTPNMHAGPPGGPNVNPNAAPGPIPATTPLVVRQDQNGVQWIAFEYSRDRVKMEYTIRCDVESINVDELPQDFKTENCVYPRACCAKDQYKGNRLHYETECNTVGWALAQLNPCLRGKRGLIQRAVDSWRNSNQDPRLRSRRVRRMAKMTTRKAQSATHGNHMAGPGGPGAPGVPNSAGLTAPPRQPNMGMGGPQMHHHHDGPGGPHGGPDDVSGMFHQM
jgi:hypothetical protein